MKRIIILSCLFLFTSLTIFGQAYPDRHSTSYTDSWSSCQETESPNTKRDPGHWLKYDFGSIYSLHASTIWNYNVPDTTSKGMRDIVIDYSTDGDTWIELGEYTMPEAPGSAFYQGDEGPDFDGVVARYVLISVLNTHGHADCAGLSEVRINATIATSTNVPEGDLNIGLAASPNPASEYTNITLTESDEKMQYSLSDISGKLLRQGMVTGTEFRLNTSNLSSGTYSLTIHNQIGQKAILINVIND